jgi:hypothetical protein
VRAFLSHSQHDSAVVHAVARRVGRVFVTIDKIAFHAADDLIQSIEEAVRESAVFVLFASQTSMTSAWVNFELNEARYHQALSRVRKLVVVVLDDRIKTEQFPAWMQRSVFIHSRAAGPIARVIRTAIDDVIGEQQARYFGLS